MTREGVKYDQKTNQRISGFIVTYYSNGQLKSRTQYKRGIKDGLEEKFNIAGYLDTRTFYKKGVKDGVEEKHSGNSLVQRTFYKNGEINLVKRFQLGELHYRSTYEHGSEVLREYFWPGSDGETPWITERYNEEGRKHGLTEIFDSDGKLTLTRCYQKGVEVPLFRCTED